MGAYKSLVSTDGETLGTRFQLWDQEQVIWNLSLKYLSVKWGQNPRGEGCWEEPGSTLSGSVWVSWKSCLSVTVVSHPPAFCSLQLWVEERLPLAESADYGTNLQTVQLFMKKNQVSLISPAASVPA